MPAATPPLCDFGWKAPDFALPDVMGQTVSLPDAMGPKGVIIAFICNHCPYVKAVIDRLVRDFTELAALGVGGAAICSNDAEAYPEDSFEQMGFFARAHGFTFPYLHDADSQVARAYDAVCTPDFFGFNAAGELQYRGRLDASKAQAGPSDLRRDLFEAMKTVAETGAGPREQIASIGCSIKWKAA